MTRIPILAIALGMMATPALAGPNWHSIGLEIEPADQPTVQAAFSTLMDAVGDDLTGSVSLMTSVAGGDSSHTIISAFDSRAEREAFLTRLYASDAWADYAKATRGLATRTDSARLDFVKDWGSENEGATVLWEMHAIAVTDEAALVAALDALQASDAGKATLNQVYLSRVAAAGFTPATHVISVGFSGEAHAESASAALFASDAWATYQEATRDVAERLGTFISRTLATWGDSE